jgi:hypothetical protein
VREDRHQAKRSIGWRHARSVTGSLGNIAKIAKIANIANIANIPG